MKMLHKILLVASLIATVPFVPIVGHWFYWQYVNAGVNPSFADIFCMIMGMLYLGGLFLFSIWMFLELETTK